MYNMSILHILSCGVTQAEEVAVEAAAAAAAVVVVVVAMPASAA